MPFCYVYRKKHSKLTNYVYEFLAELRAQVLEIVEIPNRKQYRGSIGAYDLLWRSYDDELHMDIKQVLRMFSHQSENVASAQQMPSVVAIYTLEDRDYLPKKHLMYGDLVFLEQSPVGKLKPSGSLLFQC
ncbi:uncharacterized protein ZBAI_02282 [Zygosaccharomyces bailii ISA1307]|nr:uncharacterized protein ZBAI_02282 [Zygosaccharomyces bailii ISA1307]